MKKQIVKKAVGTYGLKAFCYLTERFANYSSKPLFFLQKSKKFTF